MAVVSAHQPGTAPAVPGAPQSVGANLAPDVQQAARGERHVAETETWSVTPPVEGMGWLAVDVFSEFPEHVDREALR